MDIKKSCQWDGKREKGGSGSVCRGEGDGQGRAEHRACRPREGLRVYPEVSPRKDFRQERDLVRSAFLSDNCGCHTERLGSGKLEDRAYSKWAWMQMKANWRESLVGLQQTSLWRRGSGMTPGTRHSVNVCGWQPLHLVWGVSYTGVDMCQNSSNRYMLLYVIILY